MTTNLHDKMLAAIDAYFSASDADERDQAEEQLLDVRDEINKHKLAEQPRGEATLAQQEPVAWQILNGVCHAGIRSSESLAKEAASGMQKTHDLGGSLAAFHVRPLYATPQPPAQQSAERGEPVATLYGSLPVYDKPTPDYAWPTIEDYEKEVGFEVNIAFRSAWAVARTTNDLFKQMGENT
jgi:hypothetical protein